MQLCVNLFLEKKLEDQDNYKKIQFFYKNEDLDLIQGSDLLVFFLNDFDYDLFRISNILKKYSAFVDRIKIILIYDKKNIPSYIDKMDIQEFF